MSRTIVSTRSKRIRLDVDQDRTLRRNLLKDLAKIRQPLALSEFDLRQFRVAHVSDGGAIARQPVESGVMIRPYRPIPRQTGIGLNQISARGDGRAVRREGVLHIVRGQSAMRNDKGAGHHTAFSSSANGSAPCGRSSPSIGRSAGISCLQRSRAKGQRVWK